MPRPEPVIPADLAEVINLHREMFGGYVMKDESDADVSEQQDQDDAGGFKSPASRDAVLADLASERAERKRLAAQLTKLTEALGGDVKGKDFDPAKAIADINRRLDVAELARKHGVTDDDDLSVLASIEDAEVRAKAAERFAATGARRPDADSDREGQKPETFPRPKPDSTQGPKGDIDRPDPAPGVPRMAAALEETLAAK